jgi:hypothetical protein
MVANGTTTIASDSGPSAIRLKVMRAPTSIDVQCNSPALPVRPAPPVADREVQREADEQRYQCSGAARHTDPTGLPPWQAKRGAMKTHKDTDNFLVTVN